jgi:hypothetical protein
VEVHELAAGESGRDGLVRQCRIGVAHRAERGAERVACTAELAESAAQRVGLGAVDRQHQHVARWHRIGELVESRTGTRERKPGVESHVLQPR